MSQHHYFRINGLGSEACVLKIETALNAVQGIEVLEIDLETEMAVLKSDISAKVIVSIINGAGYNAILIPE